MIVFGWGKEIPNYYGSTTQLNCNLCEEETFWHLERVTSYFTLFWTPVFPYKNRYYLRCEECNRGTELKGETLKLALTHNRFTMDFLTGKISEIEYNRLLRVTPPIFK